MHVYIYNAPPPAPKLHINDLKTKREQFSRNRAVALNPRATSCARSSSHYRSPLAAGERASWIIERFQFCRIAHERAMIREGPIFRTEMRGAQRLQLVNYFDFQRCMDIKRFLCCDCIYILLCSSRELSLETSLCRWLRVYSLSLSPRFLFALWVSCDCPCGEFLGSINYSAGWGTFSIG